MLSGSASGVFHMSECINQYILEMVHIYKYRYSYGDVKVKLGFGGNT